MIFQISRKFALNAPCALVSHGVVPQKYVIAWRKMCRIGAYLVYSRHMFQNSEKSCNNQQQSNFTNLQYLLRMVMLKSIEHPPAISARERRAQQLLKLIEQLTVRSMTTIEAAHLLNCKSACAQKYLQQLRDEEVIILERHPESSACSKAVYRLSSNFAKIREFQELIVQPKRHRSSREKLISLQAQGSILNVTIGEHGQRIYMLADETHHAIRPNNDPVQRDPLVAALFGAASAHAAESDGYNANSSGGNWL
jgi:hypothetical protein